MKENEKSNIVLEPAGTTVEKPENNLEPTPAVGLPQDPVEENRSGEPVNPEIGGPDSSGVADASTDSSLLEVEKPEGIDAGPSAPRTGPEVGRGKEEVIREDFQPFCEKEAKAEARTRAAKSTLLYFLLAVLGLTLIGLALDTVLREATYWLEATTTAVICFALICFLWKTITLETKVGLEALAVWVIAAAAALFHGQTDLGLGGFIPGGFVLPGLFSLALAVVLTAVWMVWPRLFWPPLLLTALVLYAGLAPTLTLSLGGGGLNDLILGPPGMETWPIFLRSGYVAVQAVLPLGFVLLLILQARTLFNRRYRTHWGFLYWALALGLAGVIGLVGLERGRQPVFPPLADLVARAVPVDQTESTLPPAAPTETRPKTAPPEQPAPVREPAPPAASVPRTETPEESEQEPAEPTTAVQPEKPVSQEITSSPSLPAPAESEIPELKARIESLEDRIKELTERLEVQDELLKAIMNYVGAESGKPSRPETYEQDRPRPPDAYPQEGESQSAPPERPPLRSFQEST